MPTITPASSESDDLECLALHDLALSLSPDIFDHSLPLLEPGLLTSRDQVLTSAGRSGEPRTGNDARTFGPGVLG